MLRPPRPEFGRIGYEGPPCLALMGYRGPYRPQATSLPPAQPLNEPPTSGVRSLASLAHPPPSKIDRTGRFVIVCEVCGDHARCDNPKQRTCSHACGGRLRARARAEALASGIDVAPMGRLRRPREKRVCVLPTCGKIFEVRPGRPNQRSCSRPCEQEHRRQTRPKRLAALRQLTKEEHRERFVAQTEGIPIEPERENTAGIAIGLAETRRRVEDLRTRRA